MADWPLGTVIQIATGTTIQLTATSIVVNAQWQVFQPSGRILWTPSPFTFSVDPSLTVGQALTDLAQALAIQEFVPVYLVQLGIFLYPPDWPQSIALAADVTSASDAEAAALSTS